MHSENFFLSVLSHMPNGFVCMGVVHDDNGRPADYIVLEVNRAFESITGLKSKKVTGRRFSEISHLIGAEASKWQDIFTKAVLSGLEVNFMHYYDVSGKWYSIQVYSPKNGYIAVVFNDVTDLKEKEHELINQKDEITALYEELAATEEELRQQVDTIIQYTEEIKISEDRFKRAQEIASVGNWELDIANWTMWASEEAFRLFGIPYESPLISFETAQGIVCPQDRPVLDRTLKRLITENEPYDIEFGIFRQNDGVARVMHSMAKLERDESGKPRKVLGVIRDITAGKESEKLLRESEQRFREIAETIDEAFWIREKDRIVYVSPAYESIWGRPRRELIDGVHSLMDTVHPEDRAAIEENYEHEMDASNKDRIREYRIIRQDGEVRWIRSRSFPVLDAEGNVLRNIGTAQDFTELKESEESMKRAKEQAESANQAKSIFLANMSHEIRTPMNGMLGMIQLAQISASRDEISEFLKSAKKSADALLTIINDILDYSKIEAGKLHIEKKPFSIHDVVRDVLALFNVNAKGKDIGLISHLDSSIPPLLVGDPVRLRQVLSNLIGNAVKFTEDGMVKIMIDTMDSSESEMKLRFSVSDTGIGIPEDKLEQLFQSFSQVDSSFNKRYGGTGLGLSISKGLVKMMGGEIGVTSELGVGSEFYFTIPFTRMDAAKTGKTGPDCITPLDSGEYHCRNILLVEDDAINQMVVSEYLRRMGFRLTTAVNGVKAVEEFRKQQFDIILMDIQMPVMDGFEATAVIRAIELGKDRTTPIIALTAFVMEGERQKCLDAGMNDHLSKPVDLEELLKMVLKWTEV